MATSVPDTASIQFSLASEQNYLAEYPDGIGHAQGRGGSLSSSSQPNRSFLSVKGLGGSAHGVGSNNTTSSHRRNRGKNTSLASRRTQGGSSSSIQFLEFDHEDDLESSGQMPWAPPAPHQTHGGKSSVTSAASDGHYGSNRRAVRQQEEEEEEGGEAEAMRKNGDYYGNDTSLASSGDSEKKNSNGDEGEEEEHEEDSDDIDGVARGAPPPPAPIPTQRYKENAGGRFLHALAVVNSARVAKVPSNSSSLSGSHHLQGEDHLSSTENKKATSPGNSHEHGAQLSKNDNVSENCDSSPPVPTTPRNYAATSSASSPSEPVGMLSRARGDPEEEEADEAFEGDRKKAGMPDTHTKGRNPTPGAYEDEQQQQQQDRDGNLSPRPRVPPGHDDLIGASPGHYNSHRYSSAEYGSPSVFLNPMPSQPQRQLATVLCSSSEGINIGGGGGDGGLALHNSKIASIDHADAMHVPSSHQRVSVPSGSASGSAVVLSPFFASGNCSTPMPGSPTSPVTVSDHRDGNGGRPHAQQQQAFRTSRGASAQSPPRLAGYHYAPHAHSTSMGKEDLCSVSESTAPTAMWRRPTSLQSAAAMTAGAREAHLVTPSMDFTDVMTFDDTVMQHRPLGVYSAPSPSSQQGVLALDTVRGEGGGGVERAGAAVLLASAAGNFAVAPNVIPPPGGCADAENTSSTVSPADAAAAAPQDSGTAHDAISRRGGVLQPSAIPAAAVRRGQSSPPQPEAGATKATTTTTTTALARVAATPANNDGGSTRSLSLATTAAPSSPRQQQQQQQQQQQLSQGKEEEDEARADRENSNSKRRSSLIQPLMRPITLKAGVGAKDSAGRRKKEEQSTKEEEEDSSSKTESVKTRKFLARLSSLFDKISGNKSSRKGGDTAKHGGKSKKSNTEKPAGKDGEGAQEAGGEKNKRQDLQQPHSSTGVVVAAPGNGSELNQEVGVSTKALSPHARLTSEATSNNSSSDLKMGAAAAASGGADEAPGQRKASTVLSSSLHPQGQVGGARARLAKPTPPNTSPQRGGNGSTTTALPTLRSISLQGSVTSREGGSTGSRGAGSLSAAAAAAVGSTNGGGRGPPFQSQPHNRGDTSSSHQQQQQRLKSSFACSSINFRTDEGEDTTTTTAHARANGGGRGDGAAAANASASELVWEDGTDGSDAAWEWEMVEEGEQEQEQEEAEAPLPLVPAAPCPQTQKRHSNLSAAHRTGVEGRDGGESSVMEKRRSTGEGRIVSSHGAASATSSPAPSSHANSEVESDRESRSHWVKQSTAIFQGGPSSPAALHDLLDPSENVGHALHREWGAATRRKEQEETPKAVHRRHNSSRKEHNHQGGKGKRRHHRHHRRRRSSSSGGGGSAGHRCGGSSGNSAELEGEEKLNRGTRSRDDDDDDDDASRGHRRHRRRQHKHRRRRQRDEEQELQGGARKGGKEEVESNSRIRRYDNTQRQKSNASSSSLPSSSLSSIESKKARSSRKNCGASAVDVVNAASYSPCFSEERQLITNQRAMTKWKPKLYVHYADFKPEESRQAKQRKTEAARAAFLKRRREIAANTRVVSQKNNFRVVEGGRHYRATSVADACTPTSSEKREAVLKRELAALDAKLAQHQLSSLSRRCSISSAAATAASPRHSNGDGGGGEDGTRVDSTWSSTGKNGSSSYSLPNKQHREMHRRSELKLLQATNASSSSSFSSNACKMVPAAVAAPASSVGTVSTSKDTQGVVSYAERELARRRVLHAIAERSRQQQREWLIRRYPCDGRDSVSFRRLYGSLMHITQTLLASELTVHNTEERTKRDVPLSAVGSRDQSIYHEISSESTRRGTITPRLQPATAAALPSTTKAPPPPTSISLLGRITPNSNSNKPGFLHCTGDEPLLEALQTSLGAEYYYSTYYAPEAVGIDTASTTAVSAVAPSHDSDEGTLCGGVSSTRRSTEREAPAVSYTLRPSCSACSPRSVDEYAVLGLLALSQKLAPPSSSSSAAAAAATEATSGAPVMTVKLSQTIREDLYAQPRRRRPAATATSAMANATSTTTSGAIARSSNDATLLSKLMQKTTTRRKKKKKEKKKKKPMRASSSPGGDARCHHLLQSSQPSWVVSPFRGLNKEEGEEEDSDSGVEEPREVVPAPFTPLPRAVPLYQATRAEELHRNCLVRCELHDFVELATTARNFLERTQQKQSVTTLKECDGTPSADGFLHNTLRNSASTDSERFEDEEEGKEKGAMVNDMTRRHRNMDMPPSSLAPPPLRVSDDVAMSQPHMNVHAASTHENDDEEDDSDVEDEKQEKEKEKGVTEFNETQEETKFELASGTTSSGSAEEDAATGEGNNFGSEHTPNPSTEGSAGLKDVSHIMASENRAMSEESSSTITSTAFLRVGDGGGASASQSVTPVTHKVLYMTQGDIPLGLHGEDEYAKPMSSGGNSNAFASGSASSTSRSSGGDGAANQKDDIVKSTEGEKGEAKAQDTYKRHDAPPSNEYGGGGGESSNTTWIEKPTSLNVCEYIMGIPVETEEDGGVAAGYEHHRHVRRLSASVQLTHVTEPAPPSNCSVMTLNRDGGDDGGVLKESTHGDDFLFDGNSYRSGDRHSTISSSSGSNPIDEKEDEEQATDGGAADDVAAEASGIVNPCDEQQRRHHSEDKFLFRSSSTRSRESSSSSTLKPPVVEQTCDHKERSSSSSDVQCGPAVSLNVEGKEGSGTRDEVGTNVKVQGSTGRLPCVCSSFSSSGDDGSDGGADSKSQTEHRADGRSDGEEDYCFDNHMNEDEKKAVVDHEAALLPLMLMKQQQQQPSMRKEQVEKEWIGKNDKEVEDEENDDAHRKKEPRNAVVASENAMDSHRSSISDTKSQHTSMTRNIATIGKPSFSNDRAVENNKEHDVSPATATAAAEPDITTNENKRRHHLIHETDLLDRLNRLDALLLTEFPQYFHVGTDAAGLPTALTQPSNEQTKRFAPPQLPPRPLASVLREQRQLGQLCSLTGSSAPRAFSYTSSHLPSFSMSPTTKTEEIYLLSTPAPLNRTTVTRLPTTHLDTSTAYAGAPEEPRSRHSTAATTDSLLDDPISRCCRGSTSPPARAPTFPTP